MDPIEPVACARITLAYDGSEFHGWQVQPGLRTVQGTLLEALERLIELDGIPPGAGRTDAGVHARGQVCSVPLAQADWLARVQQALPSMMPDDIAIRSIVEAPADFHARHSARGRHYSYRLLPLKDPFRRHDHWQFGWQLDRARMQRALMPLIGDHDCTSFCVATSLEADRTRCVIRETSIELDGDALVFRISADRFLHSMVRIIVGTLVEIGRGRLDETAFAGILAARDRRAAGPTAPPQGLCLDAVDYES